MINSLQCRQRQSVSFYLFIFDNTLQWKHLSLTEVLGVTSNNLVFFLNFVLILYFFFYICIFFGFNVHTIVYTCKILLLSMASFCMYKRTTDTRPISIYYMKFQRIKIILCRYFKSFVIFKFFELKQECIKKFTILGIYINLAGSYKFMIAIVMVS